MEFEAEIPDYCIHVIRKILVSYPGVKSVDCIVEQNIIIVKLADKNATELANLLEVELNKFTEQIGNPPVILKSINGHNCKTSGEGNLDLDLDVADLNIKIHPRDNIGTVVTDDIAEIGETSRQKTKEFKRD